MISQKKEYKKTPTNQYLATTVPWMKYSTATHVTRLLTLRHGLLSLYCRFIAVQRVLVEYHIFFYKSIYNK